MNKKRLIGFAVVLAFIFTIIPISYIFAGVTAPDKVTIDTKYPKRRYKPVAFPHKIHADKIKCIECHHTWKKESGVAPKKCSACHAIEAKGKAPKIKTAFHKNCRNCHKAEAKKLNKPALRKCKTCHTK